jgi:hypothetical protein
MKARTSAGTNKIQAHCSRSHILQRTSFGSTRVTTPGVGQTARNYALGYIIMFAGISIALVLGTHRHIDSAQIAARFSYQLSYPCNLRAWVYFGTLIGMLMVLVVHLIGKRYSTAKPDGVILSRAGWIWAVVCTCGLWVIGEAAMRLATAYGW